MGRAANVTQNRLIKPKALILQNATPLTTWPPNVADECVSCATSAMQDASFQILFTYMSCARHPVCNCYKTPRLAHFWQGAESLAPAMQKHIWTFENGPGMWLLAFGLGNVAHATMACTFSTCQLPKVLWDRQFLTLLTEKCASRHTGVHFLVVGTWCALYILTWTCSSRHNGVPLFDISNSKSALKRVCFVNLDFDMHFGQQRNATFFSI